MNDYKNLLKLLFEKIERMRTETPSAGTRFRLMGLTADIWEVVETLQKNVTACVSCATPHPMDHCFVPRWHG
jgi:hypothetical protein